MNGLVKYSAAFRAALQMDKEIDLRDLKYRDSGWDSVAHMVLMTEMRMPSILC